MIKLIYTLYLQLNIWSISSTVSMHVQLFPLFVVLQTFHINDFDANDLHTTRIMYPVTQSTLTAVASTAYIWTPIDTEMPF